LKENSILEGSNFQVRESYQQFWKMPDQAIRGFLSAGALCLTNRKDINTCLIL
jgi:hypothetical protein